MALKFLDPRDNLQVLPWMINWCSCFPVLRFVEQSQVIVVPKGLNLDGEIAFGRPADEKKAGMAIELQKEYAYLANLYDICYRKLESVFIRFLGWPGLGPQPIGSYILHTGNPQLCDVIRDFVLGMHRIRERLNEVMHLHNSNCGWLQYQLLTQSDRWRTYIMVPYSGLT